MVGVFPNLTVVSSSSIGNTVVYYGRALLLLWFFSIRIRISLIVLWLKEAFRMSTDPFRTPKKNWSTPIFIFLI